MQARLQIRNFKGITRAIHKIPFYNNAITRRNTPWLITPLYLNLKKHYANRNVYRNAKYKINIKTIFSFAQIVQKQKKKN